MELKSASELYEISKEQIPILVKEVLEGVREHIIEKCIQEANSGSTYYSIYLKEIRSFAKELLLEECIKLANEFEDNGYKVSIDTFNNSNHSRLVLTFSWDGNVRECGDKQFSFKTCLYNTENGLIHR